jgi:bidirectional [NiFe] hydrogenase diaphorase subunit
MKEVSLTIDNKKMRAVEGEPILWAALDNGVYIPNLCAIRDKGEPFAACCLCFVEIEGEDEPVAACTEPVREGMVVHTNGERALRLARTSAELLLASHPLDCGHCKKNRLCELQKIARHLHIKLRGKRFRRLEKNLPIDDSSSVFSYDPNKCILCGRCVWACREQLKVGAIGFTRRGFKRMVSTFENSPLAQSRCQECGRCVKVCPVGAFTSKTIQEFQGDSKEK